MTHFTAQKQGGSGSAASRLKDLGKKVALAAGPQRQSGPAGKRASADAFRALTAKVEEVPKPRPIERPRRPRLVERAVEPVVESQVFAPPEPAVAPAPLEESVPLHVEESSVESAYFAAPPHDEPLVEHAEADVGNVDSQSLEETIAPAISADDILSLIKEAIEDRSGLPHEHVEPSNTQTVDDMLAFIRAAVFAEADAVVEERPQPEEQAAHVDAPLETTGVVDEAMRDAGFAVGDGALESAPAVAESPIDEGSEAIERLPLKVEFTPVEKQQEHPLRFVIEMGKRGPATSVEPDVATNEVSSPTIAVEPELVAEPDAIREAATPAEEIVAAIEFAEPRPESVDEPALLLPEEDADIAVVEDSLEASEIDAIADIFVEEGEEASYIGEIEAAIAEPDLPRAETPDPEPVLAVAEAPQDMAPVLEHFDDYEAPRFDALMVAEAQATASPADIAAALAEIEGEVEPEAELEVAGTLLASMPELGGDSLGEVVSQEDGEAVESASDAMIGEAPAAPLSHDVTEPVVLTPVNPAARRSSGGESGTREVRSLIRDRSTAAVDEFSAPYHEFSAPRTEPEEPVAVVEEPSLDRPAEFRFWEQDAETEEEATTESDLDAETDDRSASAADVAAPSAPAPELPSEQAAQVAQSLLDIMSLTSHSVQPQERALAADTLLHLLSRLPLKTLVTTSERLSFAEAPPARIVTRLIRDPRIAVAGPLLEKCNSIGDKDLVGVISEGHIQSIRMIARRRSLSSALCEALIATREPSTVLTLVRNPGAELSHHSFFRLNELAREFASLQAPLATRADLPAPVAFELFWVLPAELRRYVLSRFLADSATLEKILKITKAMGVDSEGDAGASLKFPPRERIDALAELLAGSERAEGVQLLAELADIQAGAARRIIADRDGDSLVIALKALGLQRSRFADVVQKVKDSGQTIRPERSVDELQNLFDSLSFNKARVLLTYWDWAVSKTGPYAELAQ